MVRGQGRLRLALPWVEALLGAATSDGLALSRMPAAEWLTARGAASLAPEQSWRSWLAAGTDAGADLLRRFPAGPCLRAFHHGKPPSGTWACARPVHLLTAIEHLRLAPGDVGIGAEESAMLLDDVNRHLEGRGFTFHAAAPGDDWQLECAEPIDCTSVEPENAAGLNLRGLMPGGRDGARVRALMNEIQMLLHDHPVNQEREARGCPAINTVWLWGFGRLDAVRTLHLPTLHTDDPWIAGIWSLHGATSLSLDEFVAGEQCDGVLVMVAGSRPTRGGSVDSLAAAERRWFAPAVAAIRSGALGRVDLLLGARAFVVESGARLKFWRRRKPLSEALA